MRIVRGCLVFLVIFIGFCCSQDLQDPVNNSLTDAQIDKEIKSLLLPGPQIVSSLDDANLPEGVPYDAYKHIQSDTDTTTASGERGNADNDAVDVKPAEVPIVDTNDAETDDGHVELTGNGMMTGNEAWFKENGSYVDDDIKTGNDDVEKEPIQETIDLTTENQSDNDNDDDNSDVDDYDDDDSDYDDEIKGDYEDGGNGESISDHNNHEENDDYEYDDDDSDYDGQFKEKNDGDDDDKSAWGANSDETEENNSDEYDEDYSEDDDYDDEGIWADDDDDEWITEGREYGEEYYEDGSSSEEKNDDSNFVKDEWLKNLDYYDYETTTAAYDYESDDEDEYEYENDNDVNAGKSLMESPHHFDNNVGVFAGAKVASEKKPLDSDNQYLYSWTILLSMCLVVGVFIIFWNRHKFEGYLSRWRGSSHRGRKGEEEKNLLKYEYA